MSFFCKDFDVKSGENKINFTKILILGTEDFLSALIIGSEHRHEPSTSNTNPFKLDYVCSAETQTRLTGFQDQNLLLQIGNNQVCAVIEMFLFYINIFS